jgi:hypothetical protein
MSASPPAEDLTMDEEHPSRGQRPGGVAAGMNTSGALTAVFAYRLVNFCMILVGGGIAMVILTRQGAPDPPVPLPGKAGAALPSRRPRKASARQRANAAAGGGEGARRGLAGIGAGAGRRYDPGMSGDPAPEPAGTGGQPASDIPPIPAAGPLPGIPSAGPLPGIPSAGPVEPGRPQPGGKPDRWKLVDAIATLVDGIASIWS